MPLKPALQWHSPLMHTPPFIHLPEHSAAKKLRVSLTLAVFHDEVGALVDGAGGDAPLELKSARVAGVVLGEPKFLPLVAHLAPARERAVLVAGAVPRLEHHELVLVETLPHSQCAIAVCAGMCHFPLHEVSRPRYC